MANNILIKNLDHSFIQLAPVKKYTDKDFRKKTAGSVIGNF